MNKYYQIKTTGKGDFPLDMLRYSQCWPMTPLDVENIGMHMNDKHKYLEKRSVTVGMIGGDVTAMHCIERFKSYNWNAEIISEGKV